MTSNDSSLQSVLAKEKNKSTQRACLPKLALLSFLMNLALCGYLYYDRLYIHNFETIYSELTSLKQLVSAQNEQQSLMLDDGLALVNLNITRTIEPQTKEIETLQFTLNDAQQQINQLTDELKRISNNDNSWMISEANYWIDLANSKIVDEHDYATAIRLLENANNSLIKAGKTETAAVRKKISEDIKTIQAIPETDYNDIVTHIISLSNSVNSLMVMNHSNIAERNESNPVKKNTVSDSPLDWKENLKISITAFLSQFISITKIENNSPFYNCITNAESNEIAKEKCQMLKVLIPADQILFLKQNLQMSLMIASQSVLSHQQTSYQNALQQAIDIVTVYFNHDYKTEAFIKELHLLQNAVLNDEPKMPQLKSISAIQALLKNR